jgi:hypothetical protein
MEPRLKFLRGGRQMSAGLGHGLDAGGEVLVCLAHRGPLLAGLAGLVATSACGRLESIPCSPEQTPEAWLASQPFTELTIASHRLIVVQPSTTAIVYLLGILGIGVGVHFLRTRNHQRSRLWGGIGLMLGGLGALLAGTSYEAFSYAIKCAGRATCAWTSWWEVIFLILTAWSVDAMTLAVAHACSAGRGRRALSVHATAHAALYLGVVLTGAFLPSRLLVSFELLVLSVAPSIVALFGLNAWRYRRTASPIDLVLVRAWLGLGLTVGAYYLYLVLGVTQALWARGIWFSENDVLHVGLMILMLFIALVVAPRLRDMPEPEAASH